MITILIMTMLMIMLVLMLMIILMIMIRIVIMIMVMIIIMFIIMLVFPCCFLVLVLPVKSCRPQFGCFSGFDSHCDYDYDYNYDCYHVGFFLLVFAVGFACLSFLLLPVPIS